ncbi:MAG: hypothetical protein ACREXW_16645 [Gammaproteobacteria bacterium]
MARRRVARAILTDIEGTTSSIRSGSVTGDTALPLGHFFGTSPEFGMHLHKL